MSAIYSETLCALLMVYGSLHRIYKAITPILPNVLALIFGRYVLDVGHTEDWFALQIAMAPCLIGYGVIARRLYDDPLTKREGNIYWKWIENYVADDFAEAVRVGSGKRLLSYQVTPCSFVIDTIEKHALLQSPSRLEELVKIFVHATNVSYPLSPSPMNYVTDSAKMETGFWNMGEGKK